MQKRHLVWIPMVLGLLGLFFLSYYTRKVPAKNKRYQFSSRKEEQDFVNNWYAATNATYFDDELPKDTLIQIHVIPPDRQAEFTIAETTPLGNGQYVIQLDPRFNLSGNQEALSLDHEICHVYLIQRDGDGDNIHGSRFQSCMRNLAIKGAFDDLW